jgi:Family of unknown function (DUF6519)
MKGDISRDTFDARKHYSGVVMQQGRVQVDADWNEQQSISRHRVDTETKDVVGISGAPLHDAGFQISTPDGKALIIGIGRYYVGGLLCENENAVDYLLQPDFPNPPALATLLSAAGTTTAIIYLDVWRRSVSALEDPTIREVALGGPDTTLRVKTVWQVKALPVKLTGTTVLSCGDTATEWDALVTPSSGLMSARAQPVQATDSPCLLPPGAGYRRLDNQLYRVEIHKGGALAAATFKWSRDNGAVVTSIEKFNGLELTVHDLGRDDVLGFSNGQWVELTDDVSELSGQSGQLVQIDHVDPSARLVVLKTAPTATNLATRPKLRRWDSVNEVAVAAPAGGDGWITLEDGVQVKFEAGNYRTGDYWLVPARTVTGDVEWPFAAPQPPRGVAHHYCRLGIATLQGATLTLQDCRKLFSPLAEVPPALHVTGVTWVNDDVFSQAQFQANGLQLVFDAPVTPPVGDAAGAIVTVTLEAPLPLKGVVPTADSAVPLPLPVALAGDVSFPAPNALLWKPARAGADFSSIAAFLVAQQVSRVRLRVGVKGSALWREQGDQRLYLDGRALGQNGIRADGSPRVDLLFPSGDARRSSDFDSWFYLQLLIPPPSLASVSVAPALVNVGAGAVGTVVLDRPAPAGGATINLSSSSPAATVPATVVVAAGQTQVTFNVTTNAAAAQNTIDVLISATFQQVTQTARLTVQVVKVAISPVELTIFVGHAQQFTATVTGAADRSLTWSVQEPAAGSVNTSGLFVAQTIGDFHVVASAVANPAARAIATVHIRPKPKDKEKEKEKEFEKISEKLSEKLATRETKIREVLMVGVIHAAAEDLDLDDGAALGRAFIRPAERPDTAPRVTH